MIDVIVIAFFNTRNIKMKMYLGISKHFFGKQIELLQCSFRCEILFYVWSTILAASGLSAKFSAGNMFNKSILENIGWVAMQMVSPNRCKKVHAENDSI